MQTQTSCGESTDEQLIQAVRAGDRSAEFELDRRWRARLVKLAFSILRDGDWAQVAAQLALWRAFRNLDRYDSARPFEPWILRIAGNCARDLLRRIGARPDSAAGEVPDAVAAPLASAAERVGSQEEIEALRVCVKSLDDRGRAVVALFATGSSLTEIGGAVGSPKNTVQYWLKQALKQLEQCMAEKGFTGAG